MSGFEACWLFVVYFCGCFVQECPKCAETVGNTMLTVFSKLIGFIFIAFGIVCPKLSLLCCCAALLSSSDCMNVGVIQ